MEYNEKFNPHTSAAALIIKATERSGLLRSVAEFLHWQEQRGRYGDGGGHECFTCELLDNLMENVHPDTFEVSVPHDAAEYHGFRAVHHLTRSLRLICKTEQANTTAVGNGRR
jgi:hypothetical protein